MPGPEQCQRRQRRHCEGKEAWKVAGRRAHRTGAQRDDQRGLDRALEVRQHAENSKRQAEHDAVQCTQRDRGSQSPPHLDCAFFGQPVMRDPTQRQHQREQAKPGQRQHRGHVPHRQRSRYQPYQEHRQRHTSPLARKQLQQFLAEFGRECGRPALHGHVDSFRTD